MRTLVICVVIAGCSTAPSVPVASPPDPGPSAPAQKMQWAAPPMSLSQSGIVGGWIDKSADPCKDFFAYACGGFTRSAVIPPDRASWGATQIVTKDNEELLKQVLEAAAAKPGSDPAAAKLGAYYASCMDEAAIDDANVTPIQPMLAEIAKVKDAATAAHAIGFLHAEGISPFFTLGPTQDYGDATHVIAGLDQAGLGLPDRKYYLEDKDTMPRTRTVYRDHQVRMFTMLHPAGDLMRGAYMTLMRAKAGNAFRIETALAKLQQDEVARRDPHAIYHRIDRAGLEKLAPSFPWGAYLAQLGIGSVTAITVNDPSYYTAVARILRTETPEALRDYLEWTTIRESADDLSKWWVEEAFTMRKELAGVKQLPPRWRRCVHHVDDELGELLGQSYVDARFAGDSKARAIELTKAVLAAMRIELDGLPWMDDPTRAAAKVKLDKMAYLVGYPDTWRRYDFAVSRTDFAGNVRAATRWEHARQLAKIGKPVDRFDWEMTPPTVNAYYDPTLNELALPAGQLQPPFFGQTLHPAVNFGSTGGGTIGHEMTHGFDDEGNQFDGDGNLRDWWSKATKDNFAATTKCVVDQYSQYEALPGVHVDGKLTAGENIADNGGVKLAYEAYTSWRGKQARPPQHEVEGYTDDQLYYLAYAQSWCEKDTPELLSTMAHSNPHSPAIWRVDGVIVNQPGFGPAFSCAAGTPMNPGHRCSVW